MPGRILPHLAVLLLALLFALAPLQVEVAMADDCEGIEDAARTTSDDMWRHEAGSEDPNDLEATSRSPNDLEVGSEDPDSLVVEPGDPDPVAPGNLADHEGHSEELQDLDYERPDDGYEAIFDDSLPELSDPTLTPEQIVALRHLKRAEAEAKAARDVYGEMRDANYPRGDARLRIIERRDETMRALEEARRAYEEAGR